MAQDTLSPTAPDVWLTLVDEAPGALLCVGADGMIRYANRAAGVIFGGPFQDLPGQPLDRLLAIPDQVERWASTRPTEIRLRRNDGIEFPARVVRCPAGDAVAWWVEDLSPNYDVETPGALFDAAPLPMLLCAIEDATVLRANRRAIELFAGERDGHSLSLDTIIGAETTSELLSRLQHGGYIDDFEVMLQTSYGEDYCGTLSGQILPLGGRRRLLVGMNDITERKQAEETLRRFFDGAPLAMLLVRTRDMHVIRINRRASELFAQDDQSLAVLMEDQLGPDVTRRFIEKLQDGGFVDNFECLLSTGWGESLPASLSGQMIEIADERCVLVGLRDITDLKRAEKKLRAAKEEAEQATLAKSQFLATMSHEIRTPMNGVLGMIDVLSTSPMTSEQKDMVSVIGSSARTLLAIIDDILDLSKIEAGKMTIEHIPLRLRQTVETTAELVAPLARGKGLELTWRVAAGLGDSFLGDPTRLRQILLNLLSNAVKFTERGSVSLRVTPDPAGLLFEVEDSGIGMSRDQSARLFKPFSQADASTTRRFGGTGLGLVICKRLVETMFGTIGLDSQPGRGSRFHFTLPLAAGPAIGEHPARPLSGLRALVADPLPEARTSLSDALRALGAEVSEAADGDGAAAILAGGGKIALALVAESLSPQAFIDRPDPPAILVLSIGNGTAATGPWAARWQATGLALLAKPVRWRTLARAAALALGQPADDAEQPALDETDRPGAGIDDSRPILVAEDNPTNRIVIGKQLDFVGLRYDMVEDGEAALKALETRSYALLFADCQMPRLDGFALVRRLREREAQSGAHLPVVALTANALAEDRDRCLAAGMDDYLAKPVTIETLSAALRRWLPGEAAASPLPSAPAKPQAEDRRNGAINRDALADLLGDATEETLALVLASFREFFPPLLLRARAALAGNDQTGLSDAAHAAKGAAASACAPELAALLDELEGKARAGGDLARLDELLGATDAAYARVERFIDAIGRG